MRIEELDYHLPEGLIATHPAVPRDHSRLMVYHRGADRVEHRRFCELDTLLAPTDLLVVNDTKVIPAKLMLRKPTGAAIPGLFLEELAVGRWRVMLRSRGKVDVGTVLQAEGDAGVTFELLERGGEKGHWIVAVTPAAPSWAVLERVGHVPLPPYIARQRVEEGGAEEEAADREEYQTVYAREAGSLAAPTAGLHFTPELLGRLSAMGVKRAAVTLHVGLGTFLPVESATLEEHHMHRETYAVPVETVRALRAQRAAGGRIVVVGTTAVRTLESAAGAVLGGGEAADLGGDTELMIAPGYQFALTDVLITNFHLPRSTLLALVGALVGLDRLKALYAEAVRERYRFYSYGDAMMVLP